jgi:hypothetical protein
MMEYNVSFQVEIVARFCAADGDYWTEKLLTREKTAVKQS